MTREDNYRREGLLFEALIEDTEIKVHYGTGYLTVFDRMLINQERAYLLSIREPIVMPLRPYQINESIEKKILNLLRTTIKQVDYDN